MIYISILEVNIKEIKKNINFVKNSLSSDQKLCAVVKANCYGLGVDHIAPAIEKDVDCFAVSSASEFSILKKITKKPILILCPVYENATKLIDEGAILSVANGESLSVAISASRRAKKPCKIHLALNTGMNRFGIKDKAELCRAVKLLKREKNIVIEGIFSHLYMAEDENCTKLQLKKFTEMIAGIDFGNENVIRHIVASNSIWVEDKFDMVRVGMAIYSDSQCGTIKLTSKIIALQNLNAGETAGYGAKFVASQSSTLAVVAIGYADGIFRSIAGKGYALLSGKRAKIVAVCMDCIILDATGISAKINDSVVLIGKSCGEKISLLDMAEWCDTISYEVLTSISSRVVRKYIE